MFDWAKKLIKKKLGYILGVYIPTLNGLIKVPQNTISEIKAKIFLGTYEYAEMKLISKYLPKNNSVIELGGSLGVITRKIQKRISKENIIVTVEANKNMLSYLSFNTLKSNKYPIVFIENAAVCNADKVYFNVSDCDNLNNKIDGNGKFSVNGTNISKILLKYPLYKYSLIIDIEGEEHNLFDYDADAFDNINDLFIELHGDVERINKTLGIINNLGFREIENIHNSYYFSK